MTVMVALLRGINVAGHSNLKMAVLRAIAEGCGFEQVASYVQSGNLVFVTGDGTDDGTDDGGPDLAAQQLRRAIATTTELDPPVHVRTNADIARVAAGNPFLDLDPDPTHHHVVFVERGTGTLDGLDLDHYAPEQAAADADHVYLFLPNGIGRSALAVDLGRRSTPDTSTTRNWRTVTRLLALAEERATPPG